MITRIYRHLYWKTNSNVYLGFPIGSLVIVEYHRGGGFGGVPEEIYIAPYENIPSSQPKPKTCEFPMPHQGLSIHLGGHLIENYHYCNLVSFPEVKEEKDAKE